MKTNCETHVLTFLYKMAYVLPTRSSSEDPIFGSYLEVLPSNKLPLKTEIYRNFLYRRESVVQTIFQRNGKLIKKLDSANKNQIVHDLVECLKEIWWKKASIPVRDDLNTFVDVKNLIDKASEFSKDMSTFKKVGREEFLQRKGFDKILDISKCRCFTKAKSIQEVEWSLCKCKPKFPEKEISFYAEQKFSRSGTIGGIDLKGVFFDTFRFYVKSILELEFMHLCTF